MLPDYIEIKLKEKDDKVKLEYNEKHKLNNIENK